MRLKTSIEQRLSTAEALVPFNPDVPVFHAADALSEDVGAVIYNKVNDKERPIAHASKTMNSSKFAYAQIEKEALAIIFEVQKFHQYLWECKFVLYTDRKPLTTIFGTMKRIPVTSANRFLQRWALILMNQSHTVEYVPTAKFGNAGGVSRFTEGPNEDFDNEIASGVFGHLL